MYICVCLILKKRRKIEHQFLWLGSIKLESSYIFIKFFILFYFFQMTCVRILEILPCVFERIYSGIRENTCDFSWLHDFTDWGKSSLKTVVVYWQRTITSLLKLLKGSYNSAIASTISTIENLMSCGELSILK